MLRVLRSLNGLIVVCLCCAAQAQPPSPPASPDPGPPAAASPPGPPHEPEAAAPPETPPAITAPVGPGRSWGGTPPPLRACAVKAFDDYAVAMSVWERDWAEGVLDARPEFKPAVIARGHAHNSALQRDGFRIHYLAANDPASLDVDESIAAMRLFDWTPEQEQALRQSQPDYAAVADAAERDRAAADAEPKSEELENYFEESFGDNAGAGAARKLSKILDQGTGALEYCREHLAAAPPSVSCPSCYSGPAASTPPGGAAPAGGSPAVPPPPADAQPVDKK